jgi:alpha-L-fucosidase
MKMKLLLLLLCLIASQVAAYPRRPVRPPRPYGAVPSPRQLRWHELELYAFLHFTTNTFTDKEWGYGDEDPKLFNPIDFDADQIVRALKAGGMRGLILTAKHHDGFCLWPTKTTTHNISRSLWRNGKGDVVKEFADACRRQGLKFGVYLSPWDRNNSMYGKPEYLEVYRAQLRELLSNYGELFEVWHDGANGGDGFYGGARETRRIDKTLYYDWPGTWALVRRLQPNAVVFSDAGPDIRWVGNEKGIAGDPCWTTINGEAMYPGMEGIEKQLNSGDRNGSVWRPAECDVSIRPGWFWHEKENSRVKTPQQLMDLYFVSTGRGASFLLNVPPDRRGRLHENDVKSLQEFGDQLRRMLSVNFASGAKVTASNVRGGDRRFAANRVLDDDRFSYWATDDAVKTAELELDFGKEQTFNVARVRENIRLGQRVDDFAIDAWKDGQWVEVAKATGIGAQRLLRLPKITTRKVRLRIKNAAASPCISEFSLFNASST